MPKRKSAALIGVANGDGGMNVLKDLRFEGGTWPVRFTVPADEADTWPTYLANECSRRTWPAAGISQLERHQNSGSWTITIDSVDRRAIDIVWERTPDGPLHGKARPLGLTTEGDVRNLLRVVEQACHEQVKENRHHW